MIEWIWTLSAFTGIAFQWWLTRDSLRSLRAIERVDGSHERRLARGHVRAGLVFLGVHCLFFFAGVRAISTPDEELPMTVARAITISSFVLAQMALVYVGFADRRDRLALRR